jgi:hypothetical protein
MTIYGSYETCVDGEDVVCRVVVSITDFDEFVHAGPDERIFVTELEDDGSGQYTVRKGDLTFSLEEDN